VKLPYVWLLVDIPSDNDTFYIPYHIDSDRGIFEDIMKIGKPLKKNDKIKK